MTIWIIEDKCDGCRRCIKACPYEGIEIKDGIASVTERCTSCGACIEACKKKNAIESDIEPRKIPDFSDRQGVWVFAEQTDGKLARVCLELLGKAQDLAKDMGHKVSAVLLGKDVSHLIQTLHDHGAQNVYLVEDDLLKNFRTIAYTNVIEDLVLTYKPNILLMGATALGRDLAPRVSRRVGTGLTADCTQLAIDPDEKLMFQTRPAFGGNVMATIACKYASPQMATVRPGVMEAAPCKLENPTLIRHKISLKEQDIRTKILERVTQKKPGTDIIDANVIVAGGRGVNGEQGFAMLKELADILGGELACTRLIIEQGILPHDAQVGQTGKTIRPEIYIACGISGAVQHTAGMTGSRYIIAINNDPLAPIFKLANWGIVGDVHEIVPEFIKQLSCGGAS
ncbi:electron transfer flavoprotein subunit alpha [Desulfobacula sp.]|uniref:electron transfer flavoprotein subunit alpha n=1 Tax=Desulfobacula sp. TaxID=2593537 RepID=UPI002619DB39|nr:electron transfer flavoprotein subunit alpha [Desulfobacula sp.]